MSPQPSPPAIAAPRWLIYLGSALIVLHFVAVLSNVLAAPSGPWPTPDGANMSTPPQFAFTLNGYAAGYLQALKLTHNYHFNTSRPGLPGVFLEVRLKDAEGRETAKLRFPDEKANFWVRHRQALLAQALADDMPVMPPRTEVIAAPNREIPTVLIWDSGETSGLKMRRVPEHLIPRDRPVFRPSEWSLLLARSYGRHLCREHDAASVELVRHTREPFPPAVLFMDSAPAGAFEELISHFGEFSK